MNVNKHAQPIAQAPWRSILALVLLGLVAQASFAAPDPFYLNLLRDGRLATERGEYTQAVRNLRLACFGFLDEPPLLAEGLTLLAMAEAASGDRAAFELTFRRLIEVEDRFRGYTQASLLAETRSSFESLVVQLIPKDFLEFTGTFAHLAERADEAAKKGAKVAQKSTKREEKPEVAEGPARGLSKREEEALVQARTGLDSAQTVEALENALGLAKHVADRHSNEAEAQYLVARIAYRASRWHDTVRYFRRGGDPGDAQPELLFYFAVALFETGEAAEAAETLKRCLPSLNRTDYVQSYIEKILGSSTS